MTTELASVLGLLAAAIVMFAANRPRMDAVALLMMTLIPFTGVVTMGEALAGFSDPNVVLIAALFVIGEGLSRTGVAKKLGDRLLARSGGDDRRLHAYLMLSVAGLGAVMSSTGVVAIFIPIVLRIARRTGTPAHQLMMPLSVAALGSGMLTLVATAPNLVVNAELQRRGLGGFGFFSFTAAGLPIVLVSIAYMWYARRWLNGRPDDAAQVSRLSLNDWIDKYDLAGREYRVRISLASPLAGASLDTLDLRGEDGANVLAVERRTGRGLSMLAPTGNMELQAGDVLLIDLFESGIDIGAFQQRYALEPMPLAGVNLADRSQDIGMAEVLVGPDSALIGKSIADAQFRRRFRLTVLGLRRGARPVRHGHLEKSLKSGDTLLVVGRWKEIESFRQNPEGLVVLDLPAELDKVIAVPDRAPHAIAVLALVVLLMVTGIVPTVQAGLIGVLLMGLLGCVDVSSAYGSIHWKSLVLIAGMMPFSLALQRTGGIEMAAEAIVAAAGGADSRSALAAIFLVTALLGLFVSNTATAVLMGPVAIGVADALGLSPRPFAMTVALAASAAYMTPISSPVNTLVVAPGGYTFGDFVRVGVPLAVMALIVTVTLVPVFFPF